MIEHRSRSVRISRDIECVAFLDVRQHHRRIRKPPIMVSIVASYHMRR